MEGTHMHFPTREYPLTNYGHSYAYPLEEDIYSLTEGIWSFCRLLNIQIEGIQSFLGE